MYRGEVVYGVKASPSVSFSHCATTESDFRHWGTYAAIIDPIGLATFGAVVLYGFGATRVAALALLTLTVLW